MSNPTAELLDGGQYTPDEIRKYETVYGHNFVSPGGIATEREILSLVGWRPGLRVLDVGCGLGGAALLMAEEFGARVHGIDLSRNMLNIARERCDAAGMAGAVTFEHTDILHYARPASYDLVHSRDVFLHIHDKSRLFGAIASCLRSGGQLLFSDYLCRAGERSADFAAYIEKRGYDLRSSDEYRALLEAAGFYVLLAEDRTDDFVAILAQELAKIDIIAIGEEERAALALSWRDKLRRARDGEQRWGVFLARKMDR